MEIFGSQEIPWQMPGWQSSGPCLSCLIDLDHSFSFVLDRMAWADRNGRTSRWKKRCAMQKHKCDGRSVKESCQVGWRMMLYPQNISKLLKIVCQMLWGEDQLSFDCRLLLFWPPRTQTVFSIIVSWLLAGAVMQARLIYEIVSEEQTQTDMTGLHAEGLTCPVMLKTPWNQTWIMRIETNPPDGRWVLGPGNT